MNVFIYIISVLLITRRAQADYLQCYVCEDCGEHQGFLEYCTPPDEIDAAASMIAQENAQIIEIMETTTTTTAPATTETQEFMDTNNTEDVNESSETATMTYTTEFSNTTTEMIEGTADYKEDIGSLMENVTDELLDTANPLEEGAINATATITAPFEGFEDGIATFDNESILNLMPTDTLGTVGSNESALEADLAIENLTNTAELEANATDVLNLAAAMEAGINNITSSFTANQTAEMGISSGLLGNGTTLFGTATVTNPTNESAEEKAQLTAGLSNFESIIPDVLTNTTAPLELSNVVMGNATTLTNLNDTELSFDNLNTNNTSSFADIMANSLAESTTDDAEDYEDQNREYAEATSSPLSLMESANPFNSANAPTEILDTLAQTNGIDVKPPSLLTSGFQMSRFARLMKQEQKVIYKCYTVRVKGDNKTKINKGCMAVRASEAASCALLGDKYGLAMLEECKMCAADKCNRSNGVCLYFVAKHLILLLLVVGWLVC